MTEKIKATRGKQATKGRGRPTEIEQMEVVTLRLPGAMVKAIDGAVKRSGHVYRDRSQFIRQTVAMRLLDANGAKRHLSPDVSPEKVARLLNHNAITRQRRLTNDALASVTPKRPKKPKKP